MTRQRCFWSRRFIFYAKIWNNMLQVSFRLVDLVTYLLKLLFVVNREFIMKKCFLNYSTTVFYVWIVYLFHRGLKAVFWWKYLLIYFRCKSHFLVFYIRLWFFYLSYGVYLGCLLVFSYFLGLKIWIYNWQSWLFVYFNRRSLCTINLPNLLTR